MRNGRFLFNGEDVLKEWLPATAVRGGSVALRPRDLDRLTLAYGQMEVVDYTHGLGLISERITALSSVPTTYSTRYFKWDGRATSRREEDGSGTDLLDAVYDSYGLLRTGTTLMSAYGFVVPAVPSAVPERDPDRGCRHAYVHRVEHALWLTLTELDISARIQSEAVSSKGDPKVNVHLTPELEQMIQRKVKTGRYNSASEVMREALRLMDERDQIKAIQKEELRKKIAAGLKSLEEGRGVDGETVFARLDVEIEAEIQAGDERASQGTGRA